VAGGDSEITQSGGIKAPFLAKMWQRKGGRAKRGIGGKVGHRHDHVSGGGASLNGTDRVKRCTGIV